MNKLPGSRATSVVLKVGGPLAAAGVVAAACSSGGSQASAPSTPAPTTSSPSTNSLTSTVEVRASGGKTFLTDGSGRSLYLWTPDTHTKSMCSGTCATAWPPLTAKGSPTAGKGVIAGDLGTINRADGTKQVTYAGHPLYTFSGDTAAGQTSGEGSNGFGAPWYLVASSGQQITGLSAASPQPGKPSASSTGGSNAGGGY
jgi:predicted lipoprotein with Yx(FWY)xxD motif